MRRELLEGAAVALDLVGAEDGEGDEEAVPLEATPLLRSDRAYFRGLRTRLFDHLQTLSIRYNGVNGLVTGAS
jgi:hypothetical protein